MVGLIREKLHRRFKNGPDLSAPPCVMGPSSSYWIFLYFRRAPSVQVIGISTQHTN